MQNDSDLVKAIGKINAIMAEAGFPVENLSDAIQEGENKDEGIKMDDIKHIPDILIVLDYTINRVGPRYNVTCHLKAIDPHDYHQVAGAISRPVIMTDISDVFENEEMMKLIDNFCKQILARF